jgi:VanZ family protein
MRYWAPVILYAGLIFTISSFPLPPPKQVFILAIIFSILYALSDEIHQFFVPGREFDLWDLAADSLGIVLVALYLNRRQNPVS